MEAVNTEPIGNPERQQMARKHVFAVNGAPEFLNLVRELLQDETYNVTTTNYVPETFALIAAAAPDLLVVDLVVGRRADWDLLERLHAEAATRGLPVIVTSTDRELLDRAQADVARYGEHQVIVKPFDLEVLLEAIRQHIGRA